MPFRLILLQQECSQNVEVLIGDVTDKAAVQSAMQGVDAVVHMAALLHIVNPPPEMRE